MSAQTPGAGPSLLRRGTRVLWRFISLHPLPFSAAVAGSVLYAITSVIGAGVLGRVTDRVITPSFSTNGDVTTSTVWFYALLVVFVALLRGVWRRDPRVTSRR